MKKDKENINRIIDKIKQEGRKREKRYEYKYVSGLKNRENVLSRAEKDTIKNKKELERYREELKIASKFNPKREKLKKNLMKVSSKIDTATTVALEKAYQGIKKFGKEKVVSRQVLKKSNIGVNIPNYNAPSILGDENRFFRGEFNRERRSMFLE